ncbi:GlxA family transcriptional regulator [Leisingera sp. ANG-Vp]|uniref:GlxA family transcriptional regulator n=1 Tax=Leisingera sp. ANG-Vp TaxID=1577896 RepID=UPI000580235F|nr:GlxA family transcriptional regulator [Leisingera sp. ANG-Vp]KIC22789.1 hypothetical protein RA20_00050 [Leisingera sp. ANG-Vp]
MTAPRKPEVTFALTMTPTFSVLALSAFVDTLRHAADDNNRNRQIYCGWQICGPDRSPIRASAGIDVTPDTTFTEMQDPDYLIAIGALMPTIDDVPQETLDYMRAFHARGGTVIGLCTGSFILGQAGLLKGRKAVVHHRHRRDFLSRYPDVQITSRDIHVRDGRVITCPGGTASIDLAISLLTPKLGRQRALKGLVEMSVDRHRQATEMAITPLSKFDSHADRRIRMAIQLMRENLSQPLTTGEIADSLGVSPSQLSRVFQTETGRSPARFRRALQMEQARWQLVNTSLSLTQIAMETGFSDLAHFSRAFSAIYGAPPRDFRKQLRARE